MILWYIIISLISGSLVFDYISSPSVSMHHFRTFADFEDNFQFARSGCTTGDIYWVWFYYACIYIAYYYRFKLLILICASIIHLINAQLSFLIWFAGSSYCVPPPFFPPLILCVCATVCICIFDIQTYKLAPQSIPAREGQKQSYI